MVFILGNFHVKKNIKTYPINMRSIALGWRTPDHSCPSPWHKNLATNCLALNHTVENLHVISCATIYKKERDAYWTM